MPRPRNVAQVRAFIGFVNYYGRFIKNLSPILHPLRLLNTNTSFTWTRECEEAFRIAKAEFQKNQILVHFDQKLPLVLATDASAYGVDAVLSHIYPDGIERPIQYASRTLSTTQQKYAQIDKEAYGISFGVKKFHQYLYGNTFTLYTDHRPLVQIFSPAKGLPPYSAMRMQHYALFLRGFKYTIKYRNTKLHGNADGLSRLPATESEQDRYDVVDVYRMDTIDQLPVTGEELAIETKRDAELKELLQELQSGKYKNRTNRNEYSIQGGIIFRAHRVVVPKTLQKRVLQELHEGHFGIVKMKGLARGYCWWSGIDADIEKITRNCGICNAIKNNPPKITNHIWEPVSEPFEKVHVDFAGPFKGQNFFVFVDAYTKWPEVYITKDITATTTINKCKEIFARLGTPKTIVSDNGRTFVSQQFKDFLRSNGIVQKLTAPDHPATNGLAERFVQTLKKSLSETDANISNSEGALQTILMQYRKMPHASTGIAPAELMLGRPIKSRLDLMLPAISKRTNTIVEPAVPQFQAGDRVSCRNYNTSGKWKFGRIIKKIGKLHYSIKLDDGRTWRRHKNQVRRIGAKTPQSRTENEEPSYTWGPEDFHNSQVKNPQQVLERHRSQNTELERTNGTPNSESEPRRSCRIRNPPERYGEYVTHSRLCSSRASIG